MTDLTMTSFYQLTPEKVDIIFFSLIMGMNACAGLLFARQGWRARYWANLCMMVLMLCFAGVQAAIGMHISIVASGIGALISALAALKAEFDGREGGK